MNPQVQVRLWERSEHISSSQRLTLDGLSLELCWIWLWQSEPSSRKWGYMEPPWHSGEKRWGRQADVLFCSLSADFFFSVYFIRWNISKTLETCYVKCIFVITWWKYCGVENNNFMHNVLNWPIIIIIDVFYIGVFITHWISVTLKTPYEVNKKTTLQLLDILLL